MWVYNYIYLNLVNFKNCQIVLLESIKDELNISFCKATLPFVDYVINRFPQLGYAKSTDGQSAVRKWAQLNNYSYQSVNYWHYKGDAIPARAINLLHKDILILRLLDNTTPTIQQLFVDFKNLNN